MKARGEQIKVLAVAGDVTAITLSREDP